MRGRLLRASMLRVDSRRPTAGALEGMVEHRWGQRIPAAIKVRLAGRPGGIGSGYLCDLSISGAFMQTDLKLPTLSRVEIEVDLNPWGRSELQRIPACVVRRDVTGIGVEWCELAPAVVCALLAEALAHGADEPRYSQEPPQPAAMSKRLSS